MKKTMTSREYREARNDYMGLCLQCGEFQYQCESDAEGHGCEDCGANRVQGIENALMDGNVKIVD